MDRICPKCGTKVPLSMMRFSIDRIAEDYRCHKCGAGFRSVFGYLLTYMLDEEDDDGDTDIRGK